MNQAKPLPPPLVPHEIVGVWAPASPPRQEEVQRGVAVLEQAGFRVLLASNLGQRQGYLAGDDDQRLQGLLELLERGCRALWAVRGGYGVMRLLPRLPWEMLSSWGGFLIGYSDLTALHAAALGRFGWATVHGPMITSLGRSQRATARILELVQGRLGRQLWRFGERQVLRPGYATGLLVGGNLSLLASLVGTPYEPPWDGVVLAVEDVGEPGYRLDRLLTQLALAGRLGRVAAVLVGKLARCGRGEKGFRTLWRNRLLQVIPEEVPVVEGLAFGHVRENLAFPLGVRVTVDTWKGVVTWEDERA